MNNFRINLYEQLKRFFEIVFSGKHDMKPHHISMYIFMLNQNNRCNWAEKFKMSFDIALQGSAIGSRETYYKTLKDLNEWGFIEYNPGANRMKSAEFRIIKLSKNRQLSVPLCEQVNGQESELLSVHQLVLLLVPLLVPLPDREVVPQLVTKLIPITRDFITLITDNIEPIKNNNDYFLKIEFQNTNTSTETNPEEKAKPKKDPLLIQLENLWKNYFIMRENLGKPVKTKQAKEELYEKLKEATDSNILKAIDLLRLATEKEWLTFKKLKT